MPADHPTPTKVCLLCKATKPLSESHGNHTCRDGKNPRCKDCLRPSRKRHRQRVQKTERYRRWHRNYLLKKKYGITAADFDRLLAAQGGRCAIRGTDRPGGRHKDRFLVDHNHITGAVRGLLCNMCNRGLGYLIGDDESRIARVIAHLGNAWSPDIPQVR